LFGLEPAPVQRARVLELGCGDGGNLLPIALTLPDARFVGIDNAASAIERGRAVAAALALENVALEPVGIEDFAAPDGGFDYVIAHGVYSWVPPDVRDRMLALCGRVLTPAGVAVVSYNALPGGRVRQALRDMIDFHTAGIEHARERAAKARELLRFLIEGSPADWPMAAAIRVQAERLLPREDASLLHDDLEEFNDPVYFHEFLAHASAHGLQYVAEAEFSEMQTAVVPEPGQQALLAVEDPVLRDQYLDFLKGRMFRQTLLCRAEASVDRSPRAAVVERLAFASPAVRSEEPAADGRVVFAGPSGSTLSTDHPAVVAALEHAAECWPAALWVRDADGDRAALSDALLRGFAANVVHLHACPPRLSRHPGDRPEASPLARLQAADGDFVTSLRHRSVRLDDELARRLVTLLDGTRDRAGLATALRPHTDLADAELDAALEHALAGLARLALLVA
jgi:SAM-dependent methyltransferase